MLQEETEKNFVFLGVTFLGLGRNLVNLTDLVTGYIEHILGTAEFASNAKCYLYKPRCQENRSWCGILTVGDCGWGSRGEIYIYTYSANLR